MKRYYWTGNELAKEARRSELTDLFKLDGWTPAEAEEAATLALAGLPHPNIERVRTIHEALSVGVFTALVAITTDAIG